MAWYGDDDDDDVGKVWQASVSQVINLRLHRSATVCILYVTYTALLMAYSLSSFTFHVFIVHVAMASFAYFFLDNFDAGLTQHNFACVTSFIHMTKTELCSILLSLKSDWKKEAELTLADLIYIRVYLGVLSSSCSFSISRDATAYRSVCRCVSNLHCHEVEQTLSASSWIRGHRCA